MAAIRRFYDFETTIELALHAGVDIFLYSRYGSQTIDRIISTIVRLVDEGVVSEDRITQSVQRILQLKFRLSAEINAFVVDPSNTIQALPRREQNEPEELEKYLF